MGIAFGIVNVLVFGESVFLLVTGPVFCGVSAGLWKRLRGLSQEERVARAQLIFEGKDVGPMRLVPIFEAIWQCVLAYVATGVTLGIRHLLA